MRALEKFRKKLDAAHPLLVNMITSTSRAQNANAGGGGNMSGNSGSTTDPSSGGSGSSDVGGTGRIFTCNLAYCSGRVAQGRPLYALLCMVVIALFVCLGCERHQSFSLLKSQKRTTLVLFFVAASLATRKILCSTSTHHRDCPCGDAPEAPVAVGSSRDPTPVEIHAQERWYRVSCSQFLGISRIPSIRNQLVDLGNVPFAARLLK